VTLTKVISTAVLLFAPAFALNPDRRISQYAHTAWRIQDGFFAGAPYSITQTTDGFNWVGTTSGIVKFDGVRFVPWNPPNGERLLASNIMALLGSSDGGLWIGTDRNGLWNWDTRRLTHYPMPGMIVSINEIRDGGERSIWVALAKPRGEATSPTCRMTTECRRQYLALHSWPTVQCGLETPPPAKVAYPKNTKQFAGEGCLTPSMEGG
jgi:ligand-binding sensor domain-containing protein